MVLNIVCGAADPRSHVIAWMLVVVNPALFTVAWITTCLAAVLTYSGWFASSLWELDRFEVRLDRLEFWLARLVFRVDIVEFRLEIFCPSISSVPAMPTATPTTAATPNLRAPRREMLAPVSFSFFSWLSANVIAFDYPSKSAYTDLPQPIRENVTRIIP